MVVGTVRYKNVFSLFFFSHHRHATMPKTTGSQRQVCYRWYCSPLLLFSPIVHVDAASAARMTPARQMLLMWLVLLSIRTGKRTVTFSQWFTLTTHTHTRCTHARVICVDVCVLAYGANCGSNLGCVVDLTVLLTGLCC